MTFYGMPSFRFFGNLQERLSAAAGAEHAAQSAGTRGAHHRGDHQTAPGPSGEPHHNPMDRWVHKAPHLPQVALGKALFNAAFHDGPAGLAASTGMVIATAGNRFNFARLLQKFLAGLKHSLSGDLTNHAVVVGMGKGAKSICDGLNGRYSHHCVQSINWPGHDTEYDAGDAWHVAAELHKLELILNILTFGYSVVYVDVDTIFFRNPMHHLLSLQADIGLPDNQCEDGLIRHDQVLFNEVLGPHFLRDADGGGDAFVQIHKLSQDHFPTWCSGPCGCKGSAKVAPLRYVKEEDPWEGVRGGALECPEEMVDQWLTFHYECTKSGAEKEVLMDISLALLEEVTPIDMSITTGV
ncbi:hypothetical protein WJX75_006537 [Coccomyxa subellipsoidea]|uniref:Nucleotide-diphospho-sugar transferase domain-containing protein n=1 Tax=Coccomyxa subellipsoidea TaxID=248742 RepID=A0ABR2YE51_9CHLO